MTRIPGGKKVTVLLKLKLPIGNSLTTEIGRNLDNYIIKGVEKEITVKRILAIDWVLKPEVYACVIAECSYWEMENETDDTLADKAAIKERAKFEVIKGI